MARIDWVGYRLDNWARWKARRDSGGLGFPSASAFMREAVSGGAGGYREAVIPVDAIEAAVTDQGVRALKESHPHLHLTLDMIYLQDYGIRRASMLQAKAESTIKSHLEQADHVLSAWFGRRAEAAKITFTT